MEPDDLMIARFLLQNFQPAIENFVVDGSTTVIGVIAGPAVALLTIYVLFWGAALASGQISEPFTDGMRRIIRMIVIVGLALTAGLYQTTIGEFFMRAPMEMAAQIALPGSDPSGGDLDSIATALDQVGASGGEFVTRVYQEAISLHSESLIGISATGLVYEFTAVFFFLIVLLTIVSAAGMVLVTSLGLTVLLAIGPLFILLALLPATQRWFEAWMDQVVNYAISVLLIILTASLVFKILDTYFASMAGVSVAELVMYTLMATVMSVFTIGVMWKMLGVGAAIGGGAAASAGGAVGRLAAMGTGAARMAVTGHSSRAITGAAAQRTARNVSSTAKAGYRTVKAGYEMARKRFRSPNTITAR